MVSVTTTGFGAAAIDTLGCLLDESRHGPLAPATVICTSSLVAVATRRSLGRRPGGVAGVAFTTLEGLALDLSGRAMASAGAHLATDLEVQAAIRSELSARPGRFGRVADHPTTEERLVSLHHVVAGAGAETLRRLQGAAEGLAGDALRVLGTAAGRPGPAWSHDRLLEATLDELALLPEGARGPLILFLPEPTNPFEGQLVATLVRRSETRVVVAFTGETVVDRRHRGRLAGWGIQVDPLRIPLRTASRLEVADPDDEVRAAVRDVVAHAAQGVPLNRMALLYPAADPYATLAAEQLDGAGLAWCGPGHRVLASTVTGRVLIRLLGLATGGLGRAAVMTLAASAPIRRHGALLPVAAWDELSRQAGVIDDEHWEPRLSSLGLGPDERELADDLLGFVAELRSRLTMTSTTWAGWVDWARDLLDHLLGLDEGWPPAEREGRAQVVDTLEGLRRLDAYEGGPDLATFESIVVAQLRRQRLPGSGLGTGLLVAPIGAVVGLDLERVVMVGLAEGLYPRSGRDDSLLPDRLRAESRGLVAPTDTVGELDVRAIAATLASSRQQPVVITARGDLRSVRSRSWPRLLDPLVEEPTILESHHQALANHGRPASLADFGLRALVTHVDGGDPVNTHELATTNTVLAQLLRRVLDRRRGELNPYVGKVAAGAIDPTERLLSATALEDYAACPRSYLLGRVLRLGDDERPEQIAEITPADRGKLLHGVLERFIDTVLEGGDVPSPGEPWSAEARQLLLGILDEEVAKAETQGITGGRVSTRILHRRLAVEMDLFLETDNALRAERRSTPVQVELGFGFDDEPSELSLPDGRVLRLRGRVDRVDATEDGGVLVIDYKGGSGRAFTKLADDPLNGGRRLQLPLYARVVADKLGRDGPRTALYWLTRNGEVRPMELVDELETDLDRTVTAALDGIAGGLFPGIPGEAVGWPRLTFDNCKYCDFDRICPTDRQREWDEIRTVPELETMTGVLGEGAGAERGAAGAAR